MRRNNLSILAFAATFLLGASAEAGPFTDDLSKCLVKSATAADHATLIQWMFSSVTLHPALQSMSTITADQRVTYNKSMAALYERLTFTDCRKEAIDALKNEGIASISTGFRVLAAIATRDIFGDPQVGQGLSELLSYYDKSKMSALYKDAGVPRAAGPGRRAHAGQRYRASQRNCTGQCASASQLGGHYRHSRTGIFAAPST